MLKLYYSPGLCSLASHIALEETGAPYETQAIIVPKGEQKAPSYLAINPRGKVPALDADGKVITENVAILFYLGKRFADAKLLPANSVSETLCLSTLAWLSNTVHPSFTPMVRPERFAADEGAQPAVKETARKTYWANCREIDTLLSGKQWMMGAQYTVCDPYALLFYSWGLRMEFPMHELEAYSKFKDRMMSRPAVLKVLKREQNPFLLPAA